jgi:hypothetical protein
LGVQLMTHRIGDRFLLRLLRQLAPSIGNRPSSAARVGSLGPDTNLVAGSLVTPSTRGYTDASANARHWGGLAALPSPYANSADARELPSQS